LKFIIILHLFFVFFQSDIKHIRDYLCHCNGRLSLSFLARYNSRTVSYELEDRLRDSKMNHNLKVENQRLSTKKLNTKRSTENK